HMIFSRDWSSDVCSSDLITLTLALLLFSCAKEEKQDYTIISGKLINFDEESFKIYGNSFEKEITPNEDGTFTDTLYIEYNGAYRSEERRVGKECRSR